MAVQFNDAADTRNRVRALEREVAELRSLVERLEACLKIHSHYPLSPDYGKAQWREGECQASEVITKSLPLTPVA